MMLSKKYFNIAILILIFLFISCSHQEFEVLQDSGNPYNITTENDLTKKEIVKKIDNLYNSGIEGTFVGKNNIAIYYKYFLQPSRNKEKGAIVISDGRTEAAVKYKEVIYDLYKNGYSVYIHDHRGQGLSGRMVADHDMGYVDEFENYIDDLKRFYNNFVKPNHHKNIYLLAHSMGGAIGVTYLEEYPNDFRAAAFSSPMLGLPFPTCLVIGIIGGDEAKYAIGMKPYKESIEPFEKNTLTHSKIRYERMLKIFEEIPKARLGGASYKWVNCSCDQFDEIFDDIEEIETPLILFSGEDEEIVSTSAHQEFIEELKEKGKNAKGYFVKKAKHEMLIESDNVRIPMLTTVLNFFNSYK